MALHFPRMRMQQITERPTMTQSIIEKLEALPRYDKDGYKDSHGPWVDWIEFSAIIEDAKVEEERLGTLLVEELDNLNEDLCVENDKQRVYIAELVKALEEAFELTRHDFAMGEVNKRWAALLAKAKEMMG